MSGVRTVRLNEKSIVVTGATGIAAAGAMTLGDQGAAIHIISIDESQCADLSRRLRERGIDSDWSQADLSIEEEAVAAFSDANARMGAIDGLFAVAGGSGRRLGDGPAHEVPLEGWEGTLALNATPAFLSLREAVRAMGETGGSVVLVSSVLAQHPSKLFATHAYAASKGAINSLTIATAARYAERRIRVNAIAPGLVRTPMSRRAAADYDTMEYAEAKQPLAGGMLDPQEIANAALFLLSDESAMVTGQVIAVDGGWGVVEASQ